MDLREKGLKRYSSDPYVLKKKLKSAWSGKGVKCPGQEAVNESHPRRYHCRFYTCKSAVENMQCLHPVCRDPQGLIFLSTLLLSQWAFTLCRFL